MSLLEVKHLKKVYTTRFGGAKVEALADVESVSYTHLLLDINAIEQNFSFCRVIQATEKFYEGGLSRTVHSDDCKPFSNAEFQADMPQGISIGTRIFERYVTKFNFIIIIVAVA